MQNTFYALVRCFYLVRNYGSQDSVGIMREIYKDAEREFARIETDRSDCLDAMVRMAQIMADYDETV